MSLKDVLWGTPQEIQADQRYGQLSKIGQRRKLNSAQEAELKETKGLSRRLFLRRIGAVLGGVAVAASPVATYLITHPEIFQSDEDRFFSEIGQLSASEQVRRIDSYYSRNQLNVITARSRVIPIWIQNYIQNSETKLTIEQILPNVVLFTDNDRTEEQSKIEFGKVVNDARRDYKGPIQINFSAFQSNRVYPSDNNPPAYGIEIIRTGFTHELVHWDTSFRHTKTLGPIFNEYGIYTPPINFADNIFVDGFSFASVEPDGTAHSYFFNLDEIASDVCMSAILDKGGHKHVFGYPKAKVMKDFLKWIGLSLENFLQYHRESDLEGLAQEIGTLSLNATRKGIGSDQDAIALGLKVLKNFHNGDAIELETFFPGTNRAIFGLNN